QDAQVQTGLPRSIWQPGGRTGLLSTVLHLVQQGALPHGSRPADTAPGPLRPREGGDRTAQPSARSGVRSASGTFRPEAADGGRAGCRGLDQPADSRDHRISTLNYDFSCLKGVDTFRTMTDNPTTVNVPIVCVTRRTLVLMAELSTQTVMPASHSLAS